MLFLCNVAILIGCNMRGASRTNQLVGLSLSVRVADDQVHLCRSCHGDKSLVSFSFGFRFDEAAAQKKAGTCELHVEVGPNAAQIPDKMPCIDFGIHPEVGHGPQGIRRIQ